MGMDPRKLALLPLLVTVACYSTESVGISGGRDTDEPAAPVKAKFPSKIVGQVNESLTLASPLAGDMDGDGLADFLVLADRTNQAGEYARPLLYLFYGKPGFPSELSTADAEAAFEVDSNFNGTVGDVNGDGYSDLLLAQYNAGNFVFGSKQRLHGIIERGTGGVMWTVGALPAPFSLEQLVGLTFRPVGDVNGDGCADLIVSASATVDVTGGFANNAWVIPGHRGEWQPTAFDASGAIANVGYGEPLYQVTLDPMESLLDLTPAGDVDGDSRDDLIAFNANGSLMFYGNRQYPAELSVAAADATLLPSPSALRAVDSFFGKPSVQAGYLGDLDGDAKDDLALMGRLDIFEIAYGQRWSGESGPEPDLTISTAPDKRIYQAAAGDVDGDGFAELLFNVVDVPPDETMPAFQLSSSVYMLRGTGERLRGEVRLSENERWDPPVGKPDGESLYRLVLGGDIDGDGSQDILTTSTALGGLSENGPVYLIPSTPRAPD
ncbi:MAG TPA: VCBS repeat-containing protein [Polyangiales bacterium]|nr:VCBS repeat-containing protein [Polyangiales bacterium]